MNWDIVDIHFVLVNEVEEKVQGTFEDGQLDLDRGFFHRLKISPPSGSDKRPEARSANKDSGRVEDEMEKRNLKKEFKEFYQVSAKAPVLVRVPAFNYLCLEGRGNPNNSPAFAAGVEVLYGLSYTLKFMIKKGPEEIDYGVMPLEGQWWAEDMADFRAQAKDRWLWRIGIMQPELITPDHVERATEALRAKKNPSALDKVSFRSQEDGLSAQILHLGPYDQEGPTIERLHAFIIDQGRELTGLHREIYLSDLRRTAPERLKTIIRQPCG
jgi:hypothetical protein